MNRQELDHLKDLMKSFPASFSADQVNEANRQSYVRFNNLINWIVKLSDIFDKKFSFDDEFWLGNAKIFHEIIFKDIFSVAGEFRDVSHPDGGRIFFGGQKHNELRHEFSGVKPEEIKPALIEAFAFIKEDNAQESPLANALKFYQLFVRTHPFYDGNGRIARMFVDIYLFYNGLSLNWKLLSEKENKFLKKLNHYHKTKKEKHFRIWYNFCKSYLSPISSEDQEK